TEDWLNSDRGVFGIRLEQLELAPGGERPPLAPHTEQRAEMRRPPRQAYGKQDDFALLLISFRTRRRLERSTWSDPW
ncbi:MAG: hypothetical protein ACJ8LM_15650, partial [Candidatus Udaeobacter sp.]